MGSETKNKCCFFVTASSPARRRQPFREITLAIFLEGRKIYRGHDETGLLPTTQCGLGPAHGMLSQQYEIFPAAGGGHWREEKHASLNGPTDSATCRTMVSSRLQGRERGVARFRHESRNAPDDSHVAGRSFCLAPTKYLGHAPRSGLSDELAKEHHTH